jgi:hypothetical protein
VSLLLGVIASIDDLPFKLLLGQEKMTPCFRKDEVQDILEDRQCFRLDPQPTTSLQDPCYTSQHLYELDPEPDGELKTTSIRGEHKSFW